MEEPTRCDDCLVCIGVRNLKETGSFCLRQLFTPEMRDEFIRINWPHANAETGKPVYSDADKADYYAKITGLMGALGISTSVIPVSEDEAAEILDKGCSGLAEDSEIKKRAAAAESSGDVLVEGPLLWEFRAKQEDSKPRESDGIWLQSYRDEDIDRMRPQLYAMGGEILHVQDKYVGESGGTLDEVRMPEGQGKIMLGESFLDQVLRDHRKNDLMAGIGAHGIVDGKEVPVHDPVNKPTHYNEGGIEVIDIMEAKLTAIEFYGYLKGNVMKYTLRADLKGGTEDWEKAQWYINRLISFRKNTAGVPIQP